MRLSDWTGEYGTWYRIGWQTPPVPRGSWHPADSVTRPMRAKLWECDSLIGQGNMVPDTVLVGKLGLFLAAAGHPVDALTPPMRARLCESDALIGQGNTWCRTGWQTRPVPCSRWASFSCSDSSNERYALGMRLSDWTGEYGTWCRIGWQTRPVPCGSWAPRG